MAKSLQNQNGFHSRIEPFLLKTNLVYCILSCVGYNKVNVQLSIWGFEGRREETEGGSHPLLCKGSCGCLLLEMRPCLIWKRFCAGGRVKKGKEIKSERASLNLSWLKTRKPNKPNVFRPTFYTVNYYQICLPGYLAALSDSKLPPMLFICV